MDIGIVWTMFPLVAVNVPLCVPIFSVLFAAKQTFVWAVPPAPTGTLASPNNADSPVGRFADKAMLVEVLLVRVIIGQSPAECATSTAFLFVKKQKAMGDMVREMDVQRLVVLEPTTHIEKDPQSDVAKSFTVKVDVAVPPMGLTLVGLRDKERVGSSELAVSPTGNAHPQLAWTLAVVCLDHEEPVCALRDDGLA